MDTSSPQPDISKLPKWAQDHIKTLQRERDEAIRTLNRFVDNDTPSPFYVLEHPCLGEEGARGPVQKRRYVQAHSVYVEWQNVCLEVSAHDFGNTGSGIKLSWGAKDRSSMWEVAFIPTAFQQARLVSPHALR